METRNVFEPSDSDAATEDEPTRDGWITVPVEACMVVRAYTWENGKRRYWPVIVLKTEVYDTLGCYRLGPNADAENGIFTGDAKLLSEAIPDESVDLIFCDPVYDRITDYRWLAETAARVLKRDGVLLCWSNGKWHYRHTRTIDDLDILNYPWTFAVMRSNTNAPMDGKIISKTNRVLWFDRGFARNMRDYLPDGYLSIGGQLDIPRSNHRWGKSNRFTARCIRTFSGVGGVVWDPMTRGGTTPAVAKMQDRRWLAFEIIPEVAAQARLRVARTQPPLPLRVEEQLRLPGDVTA